MTGDYKVKPETIEFLRIAIDFLRKHEKTARFDVDSIRVLDYYWASCEVLNLPVDNHRFKIQFDISGSQHEAIIIIKSSYALLNHNLVVVYAMLDGHYDLILNKELVDIILEK
jgi:hypothetical protein